MRILNDEEIAILARGFPITNPLPEWKWITTAQHQADLKAFIAWIEEARYKTPYLEGDVMISSEDFESFKQMVAKQEEEKHGL